MSDPRLARPLWRGRTNVDALTIACIEAAEKWMQVQHPETAHLFTITQGSYQGSGGDPNSAGTHALGGVVDLHWCGHDVCILALRMAGMAATWHRTPEQGPWPHHTHAVVMGHPYLAPIAARQVDDVLNGRNGLASHAPDDGPRLNPFPPPVWPPKEDDMPLNRDDLTAIRETVDASVAPIANRIGDLERLVKKKAENSWNRDKESRKLLVTVIKQMVENGADLDELVAYVEKHGQPD